MRLGNLIAYFFEFCFLSLAIAAGTVFSLGVATFDHNSWLLVLLMVLSGITFCIGGLLNFVMPPMPKTAQSMKWNRTSSRFFLVLSSIFGLGAIAVQLAGISTFVQDSWILWVLLVLWLLTLMRSSIMHANSEPDVFSDSTSSN